MGKFAWSAAAKGDRRECGPSRRYTRSSPIAGQREYHRDPANGVNCGDGSTDDCEAAATHLEMVTGLSEYLRLFPCIAFIAAGTIARPESCPNMRELELLKWITTIPHHQTI